MDRKEMLARAVARPTPWDMIVIGGGATGVGVAVDAASRGYEVLLIEKNDFCKGTSSRSTKLVHGGVRYLEQGNIPLVMGALRERGLLRQNAPHLVHDLPFVVPNYDWWEAPFYGLGLKMYDLLAGRYGFGSSRLLSKEEILQEIPTIKTEGLRGGVMYYDGQFDDSRLLINLATTAVEQGAVIANYVTVNSITKDRENYVDGVIIIDQETGRSMWARGRVIINATGPFTDDVRKMADPTLEPIISPSQGIHLVFDRSFLPGNAAIMVPHTSDGRVMFAIPWHQHTLVGTTDTPIAEASFEPQALEQEIEFILETAGQYLNKAPTREDILSTFVGIRPLVKTKTGGSTAQLSRDHTVHIDSCGLLSICGGKWTTYRHMAEDCVDHAIMLARLEDKPCITKTLKIHGWQQDGDGPLAIYGSDAEPLLGLIAENQRWGEPLHTKFPFIAAQVVWAARHEMARTVEDFLARRVRALFLDAQASIEMAPKVAELLAGELGRDEDWQAGQIDSFIQLARQYIGALTTVSD